jgi:hypothetical protein
MRPANFLDLDQLLKLRLVVARVGEMDLARWWNTQGMLGPRGAAALRRGLPRTHYFAQARVVFTVAGARCADWFNPPSAVTLWSLPAEVEDQFEDRWQQWLDDAATWSPFFEKLAQPPSGGLLAALDSFQLLSADARAAVSSLRRSAENRAVQLTVQSGLTSDCIALLAAAFSLGEVGALAVPYMKWEGPRA